MVNIIFYIISLTFDNKDLYRDNRNDRYISGFFYSFKDRLID